MKAQIDVFVEKNPGRMTLVHSATNDDAATFDYSGEVIVDDASSGEVIHNTNFDNVLALVVVNVGTASIVVRVNTDSTPASTINLITLLPGGFCLVPKPEHATSKTVTLFAAVAGQSSKAKYWVSGD